MSKKIHIANESGEPILVMVTTNKDFLPADVGFSFVKSAAIATITGGAGAGAAAETAGKLTKTIKTLNDFYNLYSKMEKVYKLADAATQKHMHANMEYVRNLIRKSCITIMPSDFKEVNEKFIDPFENVKPLIQKKANKSIGEQIVDGFILPIQAYTDTAQILYNMWKNVDPSVSLGVFGAVGDLTIFITTADFRKISCFNTNCDHSWIVKKTEIVRSKHGTIWQQARDKGWHIFSTTRGAILAKDDFLEPFDSLDTQTVNFEGPGEFLPEMDHTNVIKLSKEDKEASLLSPLATLKKVARFAEEGINTIAKKGGELIHGVANLSSNIFSYPYKLVYQQDGNLVLYHIKGDYPKVVWATDTAGKPAGRVRMQEDGNFVMYGPDGKVQWAVWQVMPPGYENSFVGLDKINGRLAYYKNGKTDKPAFYINDRKECYKP